MKIVRIIARLNVGGPTRHVVWLTNALQNDDYQSVLLAGTVPDGEEDMSWFAAKYGVSPRFIPEMSRELSLKDIVALWKVFRVLLREKPDIIHTHTAKAGTVGRVAGFFYRWLTFRQVKIIHTYHGHIFHSYYGNLKTKLFLLIEKSLARLTSDKIIVISRQQFEEIHRRFKVGRAEQFKIITLGIDLEPFRNWHEKRQILRHELQITDEEILVGLVGRLTEIKNISFFLRVIKLYQARQDSELPKMKFVIIGDGSLRKQLEAEAELIGIKDNVQFLGNRKDADVFYAGLDIVALTSLNEGTPLSLIEGMANSRPVISTAVGGVVDLLGEAQTQEKGYTVCQRGIRVEPFEQESFLEALVFLAKNADLRRQFGENGRKFIYAEYSKENLIANVKRLYNDLEKG